MASPAYRIAAPCRRRLAAALCALLAHALPAGAEVLAGTVVGVADGDTLTVLDAARQPHKIRLLGIDAPEKAQPHGQRARQHLARLAWGREVRVEWHKRDRFGRILGKVIVPAGDCRGYPCPSDAGLAQLESGMAWWFARYAADQTPTDRDRYRWAEAAARERGAGLWRDPQPEPPWDWRRR